MLSDQKILLAGLNDDERRPVESALIRSGFDVYHIQWQDALPEDEFACIILNLQRDDYRSASTLLKDPRLGRSGCIMLVDASDEHSRLIAMTLGTDDIVYKPVHLRELIAKVSILIDKYLDRQLGMSTCLEDDIDLLQRLQDYASRKFTGTLWFKGHEHHVAFSFENGLLVGANSGKKQGINAITAVWRSLPAQVKIQKDVLSDCNINPPFETSRAISHIADTIQTWQKMFSQPHSLETVCSIDWRLYAQFESTLPRQVRRIIQLFDGIRTIDDILDAVNLDDRLLVKILAKLAQDSILRIERGEQGDVPLDLWVNQNLRSNRQHVSAAPKCVVEETPEPSPAPSESEPEIDVEVDEEAFDEDEPTPSVILYTKDLISDAPEPQLDNLPSLKTYGPEENLERKLIEMCKDGILAELNLYDPIPVDPKMLEEHNAHLGSVVTAETVMHEDLSAKTPSSEQACIEQEEPVKAAVPSFEEAHRAALSANVAPSKEAPEVVQTPEVEDDEAYDEEDEFDDDADYEEYEDDEYYETTSAELSARGILDAFSRINPGSEDGMPKLSLNAEPAKDEPAQKVVVKEKAADEDEEADEEDDDPYDEEEDELFDGFMREEDGSAVQKKPATKKFPTPDEWQQLKLNSVKRAAERRHRYIEAGLVIAILIIVGVTLYSVFGRQSSTSSEAESVGNEQASDETDAIKDSE